MMGGLGGFQNEDSTAGFTVQPEEELGIGGGMDLSFIPGLGFADDSKPPVQQENMSIGMPDFDIDLNSGGSSAPALDFDLGLGDDTISQPQSFSPGLNTDANTGFGTSSTEGLTNEQIFDAMAPVLMDMISEVRRSLDYYSGKFQSMPDSIMLCGGTAKMQGLAQLVQNELGIPVTLANPLKNVTVSSLALSKGNLEEVATIFPVSLGLAVRDMIGE
jgi:type IV pilus assembly protein PilM